MNRDRHMAKWLGITLTTLRSKRARNYTFTLVSFEQHKSCLTILVTKKKPSCSTLSSVTHKLNVRSIQLFDYRTLGKMDWRTDNVAMNLGADDPTLAQVACRILCGQAWEHHSTTNDGHPPLSNIPPPRSFDCYVREDSFHLLCSSFDDSVSISNYTAPNVDRW
jgi:hypothetical protein